MITRQLIPVSSDGHQIAVVQTSIYALAEYRRARHLLFRAHSLTRLLFSFRSLSLSFSSPLAIEQVNSEEGKESEEGKLAAKVALFVLPAFVCLFVCLFFSFFIVPFPASSFSFVAPPHYVCKEDPSSLSLRPLLLIRWQHVPLFAIEAIRPDPPTANLLRFLFRAQCAKAWRRNSTKAMSNSCSSTRRRSSTIPITKRKSFRLMRPRIRKRAAAFHPRFSPSDNLWCCVHYTWHVCR